MSTVSADTQNPSRDDLAGERSRLIGTKLSRFVIMEEIGKGGMGVVYRARDEHLDREVAVKVLAPGILSEEVARKRFCGEAVLLARLNHPNIAMIHDFDSREGLDFIVMEYVPGVSLREKLKKAAQSEKEVLTLGLQLAAGLEAAHDQGVVHRDLKPGNLRVTPDGRLKILDFGLARLERPLNETSPTESLGAMGEIVGTPAYMSPEQLLGEDTDSRADLYAAGSVLYELATGSRPFPETTLPRLIDAVLHKTVAPAHFVNRKVSMELSLVLQKALDKKPNRRYQSARELQEDLERLMNHKPIRLAAQRRETKRCRRRTRRRVRNLAVLPLANLSGDPAQEYLADGMTERLITELAKVRGLRLVSRTSAMRYKNSEKPLREIALELAVDTFLEGSLVCSAKRIRVTVQLIDAETELHLWAESYERDSRNLLAWQNRVAIAIARVLRNRLVPSPKSSPRRVVGRVSLQRV